MDEQGSLSHTKWECKYHIEDTTREPSLPFRRHRVIRAAGRTGSANRATRRRLRLRIDSAK